MQDKKKIYIPFIDGVLDYDCRACRAGCCRQAGNIIMSTKEKEFFFQRYPFLKYFSVEETDKTYIIKRLSACWFLEDDGLCHIQKRYGYSTKAFICRLYPFWVTKCRDEYIVTLDAGEWGICPMLYVARGSKNSSRRQILKDAQEAIELDVLSGKINWSKKRLKLEKKILEGSKRFLNNPSYLDFSAHQMALAKGKRYITRIKRELTERLMLWKSFLGVDKLNLENKKLTYELTAVTPLLRIESPQLRGMNEKKIPLALLALYIYMILFLKVNKTKTYVTTYKRLLNDIPLIGLLSLENKDESIKNKSIEKKLRYLRILKKLQKGETDERFKGIQKEPRYSNAQNSG